MTRASRIWLALLSLLGYGYGSNASLRGTSSETGSYRMSENGVSSVLCHVMERRVEYVREDSLDHNSSSTKKHAAYDTEFVCETTAPNQGGDNREDDDETVFWAYRLEHLPAIDKLDLDKLETSWIRISHAIRHEDTGTLLVLPNARIDVVTAPANVTSLLDATSAPATTNPSHRHLTPAFQNLGISKILVVRVQYLDHYPNVTADDLRGRIFGMGPTPDADTNLRRQIKSCSFGKLILEPVDSLSQADRSNDSSPIIQGVTELHITEEDSVLAGSNSVRRLENVVRQKLKNWYGVEFLAYHVNHVMIVNPGISSGLKLRENNYLAYAFMRSKWSVYNNYWATSISALAHEFGHNLNLAHAGEYSAAYGDTTGYMGSGVEWGDYPRCCYNAQKNWFLQWYQDRTRALLAPTAFENSTTASAPQTEIELLPWTGDLVAFVDYDATSIHQPVLLQVQSDNQEKRLYLQYNRAKKFNRDTREHKDQIVIIEETGTLQGTFGIQSWLVGAISPPPINDKAEPGEYQLNFTDFASRGRTLQIQACQHVLDSGLEYVRMSVFLEGQTSGCVDSTHKIGAPYPTQAPTFSLVPSLSPSLSLTPSDSPSEVPSSSAQPTAFCEDFDDVYFEYWDERIFHHPSYVNCAWLKRQPPSVHDFVCNTPAYDICPDTCGKCEDNCEDDLSKRIYVNRIHGYKTCLWLWARPQLHERLCTPGSNGYNVCKETCNSCPRPTKAPTTGPTTSVAPTTVHHRSSVPTSTPACEDSKDKFKLYPSGKGYIKCPWLTKNSDIVSKRNLCNPNNTESNAHKFCPDTCNLCYDGCDDETRRTFYVDRDFGFQDCHWLSRRPHFRDKLCVEGHRAYNICRESCNNCPAKASCEDSPPGTTFWIRKKFRNARLRDCVWLARRPKAEQERWCNEGGMVDVETARHICPETCGSCSDQCEDSPTATFFVNRKRGTQNCKWLATRPAWQELLCQPWTKPYAFCKETCNSCADE